MKVFNVVDSLPSRGGGGMYVKNLSLNLKKKYPEIDIINVCSDKDFEGKKEDLLFITKGKNTFTFFLKTILFGLRKEKFDVYDGHGFIPGIIVKILSILKRSKSVLHVHGFSEDKNKLKFLIKKIIVKLNYNSIICASEYEYEILSKIVNPNKIHLIKTGVEIGKKKEKINKKRKILYVGRLEKVKGFDIFMEAIRDTNYDINIIGTGSLKEIIPHKKNISYFGPLNHNEVIEKMRENDIIVMPSRSEGFPLVLYEAMTNGLIIICSDIPQFTNLTSKTEGLFVFKELSANNLKEKIEEIIVKDDSSLKKASDSNYDYIVNNNLTWEKTAENTKKRYDLE